MTEGFEGLSLSQLVDLLHDIVAPPAVSMIPHTVGWQLLGAWLFAAVLIIAVHVFLGWHRDRYRREADAALSALALRLGSDEAAWAELGALLKRTAMQAYSRDRVAALYGDAWADFLTRTTPGDELLRAAASRLASVAYEPPDDPEPLLAAARRWIRCHRV